MTPKTLSFFAIFASFHDNVVGIGAGTRLVQSRDFISMIQNTVFFTLRNSMICRLEDFCLLKEMTIKRFWQKKTF